MIATGVLTAYEDSGAKRFYITFKGGLSAPEQRIEVPTEAEGWDGCALINEGQKQ